MFANTYLLKNNRVPLIQMEPNAQCNIRIVIPCYNEPELLQSLESLKECSLPNTVVEVIILINHAEDAPLEIKNFNMATKAEADCWIQENNSNKLIFFAIGPVELRKKWAGVGLARKTGLDEAVLRFNHFNNTSGIVVSLDSDSLVEPNYLIEIEKHFKQNPKHVGATIKVEHQKAGLSERQKHGIELYEKYLHYYKDALHFTGYPQAMITIGSAFAVTAEAYVKRGGMNRRQAGEDFYFLQNLAQLGTVGEINTTRVYPSARLSNRVPFGTGAAIQKWMAGTEDLTKTYNFKAFADLKTLFDTKERLFQSGETGFTAVITDLPESVRQFVLLDNFKIEIEDLNKNCSTLKSFQSRFFHKFNAFKVLKFMNFAHEKYYGKADLEMQCQLLKQML
ncbi:MAG TPA: glycosyltransferase [Draconibacterium sp.]|nr:glycosyltransferase [Draconibacterium sp.]